MFGRRSKEELRRDQGVRDVKPLTRFATVPDGSARTEVMGERASNAGVLLFSLVVFALMFGVVAGAWWLAAGSVTVWTVVLAAVLAALASMSVHIAQQWEKVVVLRFGAFDRVSGPGLFWTLPIIEQNTMRVDTRVRATTFGAEETLTADLVPLVVLDHFGYWDFSYNLSCLNSRRKRRSSYGHQG